MNDNIMTKEAETKQVLKARKRKKLIIDIFIALLVIGVAVFLGVIFGNVILDIII